MTKPPPVDAARISTGTLNLRGHADHEQSSEIAIAFLADTLQTFHATTRSVQRRNPYR